MVTWAEAKTWRAAPLAAEVTALGSARDTLQGMSDELDAMTTPAGWTGDAARSAGTRRTEIGYGAQSIVYEVSLVRAAVDEAEDTVRGVERRCTEAADLATASNVTIDADGTVRDNAVAPFIFDTVDERDAYYRERRNAVEAVALLVQEAVDLAADADATLAAVLDSAHGDQLDSGHTNLAAAAAAGYRDGQITWPQPPADGDPQAQADWWESLTPSQQQEILDDHPDLVGNRDGIPAWARDEANRNRLDGEMDDAQAELAAAQARMEEWDGVVMYPGMDRLYLDDLRAVEEAQAKIDAITQVQDTLALGDRQLLLLDTDSGVRVQAAIANGNVDTADHVAAITPGLTTTVGGSMAGYDAHMAALRASAEGELDRYGMHDQSVATIAWLGYDAPQWDESLGGNSVALSNSAKTGGDSLASFYTGINASRPDDPNVTALGHSYGSTTLGYAMRHEGTGVDNAVFMSSPGITTQNLDDLHVPTRSTYYLENDGDIVADLGRFGGDPTGIDDITHLSTYDGTAAHGEHMYGTRGHTDVFAPGSMAQYNTALVVAGLEEHIVSERAHEFWTDPVEWPW